ncbi:MAG: response regulator transcription factor [Blastocatellia bacterium]
MPDKLCHILFVEDNADTGQLVTMILESRGYSVTCVPTKSEALALVKKSAFDLYLLDYRLPDGNGVDLCRHIRDLKRREPILFFSAAAYEKDMMRAIEAGADGYMTKPIDPYFLVERVAGLVDNRWPTDVS